MLLTFGLQRSLMLYVYLAPNTVVHYATLTNHTIIMCDLYTFDQNTMVVIMTWWKVDSVD